MAIQNNAKTKSDAPLSESGTKLMLAIPAAPYKLPHKNGGFAVIMGFEGDPAYVPAGQAGAVHHHHYHHDHHVHGSQGCGSCGGHHHHGDPCKAPTTTCEAGCECSKCMATTASSCGDPCNAPRQLLRYEIVKYSGYEADGTTLIITERGVDGTSVQNWPAGAMVMQTFTGADYDHLMALILNGGISTDAGNLIAAGTDGGVLVKISSDAGNAAALGTDGGVMVKAVDLTTVPVATNCIAYMPCP